jgi:hypothetical protein
VVQKTPKGFFNEMVFSDHEYASETADGCVVYFFVPVSDYRWFRFELEALPGVESTMVFGEVKGTPRGEITDEMLAEGKAYSDSVNASKERHPDEALFDIDEEPVSDLVSAFERQFSQEEAEAISAGFDGDVKRAAKLYRELTEYYVSHMTVEDLIKAGKS